MHALANSEYRPLAQRFDVHRKQMLLALDRAYYDKTMGKKDKQKLVELICSTALDLMECDEGDDNVKAIYNTHSGGKRGHARHGVGAWAPTHANGHDARFARGHQRDAGQRQAH